MGEAIELPEEPRVTTTVDAAWKGVIEPYNERSPVLDIPAGVVACQFCGNTRFRRSRVRLGDVVEVFLLRLPLRCMRCNQRQYGSFLTASVATGTKNHEPRQARGHETWQAWTGQEMGRTHRPMTTAVGTRATKLRAPAQELNPEVEAAAQPVRAASAGNDHHIW